MRWFDSFETFLWLFLSLKIALQAFLQYPHLKHIVGIEFIKRRYELSEAAVKSLLDLYPEEYELVSCTPGADIVAMSVTGGCVLHFKLGDLFDADISRCDVAFLNTQIPEEMQPKLAYVSVSLQYSVLILTYIILHTAVSFWNESRCPTALF